MPGMQRLHETHRQGKGWGVVAVLAHLVYCCKYRHDIYAFKWWQKHLCKFSPPPPLFQYASEVNDLRNESNIFSENIRFIPYHLIFIASQDSTHSYKPIINAGLF